MFRFVGWLVVTGFSLYGLSQFIDKHVVSEEDNDHADDDENVVRVYPAS